jgi:UDP-N-acetylmuramyl pentapeptide phosphotransferase/UDP-N-acetylglucosamine-1-phosphate transferase
MIDGMTPASTLLLSSAIFVVAAMLSIGLVALSLPALRRHFLVKPDGRSSHRAPTPQGGGAAVVIATFATAGGALVILGTASDTDIGQFLALLAAATAMAIIGALDDWRGIAPLPRFILQCLIVGSLLATVPASVHIVPELPLWVERAVLLVAGVWFVNLVNFMDGVDWMTVAETIPISGGIALAGLFGIVPPLPSILALCLLGSMVGFAPYNRPTARLFLGDVGSLSIGLVLGWLLLRLAQSGHGAAAILLPLYYLADATITLARRLAAKAPVWRAHRTHFYQIAMDRGFSVPGIVSRVFVLNLVLAGLAFGTIAVPSLPAAIICLAVGGAAVGWVLMSFARGPQ